MIPKKSSAIYKELVEEINVPIELVEDLIQAYYKSLRNELTNLTEPRVNVEGLGQFVARPALVKKSIIRYKKVLDSHDTSTFKAYYNKKMLEDKLEKLENLDLKIEVQDLKKQEFIKKKNESSTESNLGEQESNS
jgi:predicted DNA-binding protein